MARHIHIHFAPRRTRDQALGSVPGQQRHPPAEVSKLVQVLMQAIADRQSGRTTDEQARARNGQFTSGSGGGGGGKSATKKSGRGNPNFGSEKASAMKAHAARAAAAEAEDEHEGPSPLEQHWIGAHTAIAKKHRLKVHNLGWGVTESGIASRTSGGVLESEVDHDKGVVHHYLDGDHIGSDRIPKHLLKHATRDAGEWDESKHPRAEGGQFSSAQHAAAAKNHEDAANAHEASAQASMGPVQAAHAQAATMHKEAADLHAKAHSHMAANTGLGQEFARSAHAKTKQAAAASNSPAVQQAQNSMGEAYSKLKAVAGDPKQPVARRAEAVKHLEAMEKQAETLAKSPHAQAPATASGMIGLNDPNHPANTPMPKTALGGTQIKPMPKPGTGFQPTITSPMGPGNPLAGVGEQSGGGEGPAGDKPTMATAAGSAKAKTHQLLSSGHPFHVEELMKATGVNNKATIMTALSDLKNPKYAGALGALTIEKRPDGMYHVTKAPAGGFKAVGGAAAPNATPGAAPTAGTPAAPTAGTPDDPTRVANATHPMSDYLPGQHLQGNGVNGKLWKVLGHNAEGHVVIQSKETGAKHHMDPAALKKAAKGVADPDSMKGMTAANPTAKVQARMKPGAGLVGPGADPDVDAFHAEQMRKREAGSGPDGQPIHPELQAAARRMGENPSTAPKHTPGSMVPAPESALKAGMAAGLKKNLKSQATEGKNRVERALGNHSSTFVKQAMAAQAKPKQVSPLDHPDGRRLADHIDDVNTSLRNRPDDSRLHDMVHRAQTEFKQKFGSYYGDYKPGKSNAELANEDASPKNYMDDLPKKKSIWGTPKPTLKPKDLAVRSGQNTDPKMAVKSAAGPSAPGKKTLEQVNHHKAMEQFHREEADRVKGRPGAGSYKDHLRAAQMHANAAQAYQQGQGKGGWTPVHASNANALSKTLGFVGPGVTTPKAATPGKA